MVTVHTLTIWDCSGAPAAGGALTYRWNGYAEGDAVHSLLRYVDTHGERLRGKYMAWIHDLGESRIGAKRLIDHLARDDGLSFWWTTLLVEKSPWKSPSIVDAIRLFALEEIIAQHNPGQLRLVSANRKLHATCARFSRDLGLAYEWEPLPGRFLQRLTLVEVYRSLPQAIQALLSFTRHLLSRWPLRQADKSRWFRGEAAVFFCSYFLNLDREASVAGRFHSHQWEGLPGLLHGMGRRANWLQHYNQSSAVPNVEVAKDLVRRFNRQRDEGGFHSFVDAYLSWRIVLRVVAGWLKLTVVSLRIGAIRHAFRPAGSRFSLWPLIRRDWSASIRGPVAIVNLLWIELFDEAMRDLPHQPVGLFLCENHEWEKAFIHTWRKHGHGRLIGVVHTTVRFWDLRYFTDPRTVRSTDPSPLPQADLIALNGKAAVDAYRAVDFPAESIVECEAVRYGYLGELPEQYPGRRVRGGAISVLILADSVPSCTDSMLRLLEAAVSNMDAPATYTLKPHPTASVDPAHYPSLRLDVVTAHLGQILHEFDVAFASNITSAGVDAYLAGLPVVVMLDATELNFSPLRGRSGVRFVATAQELAEALRVPVAGARSNLDRREFFHLDTSLPRWKRLLANCHAHG